MSEEDNVGEPQGTGIVLRRKKRDDGSPSKAGDALAIAELVQKLCQVHIPGHDYCYWKLSWRAAFVVHRWDTCIKSTFWLLRSGCTMDKKIWSWFVVHKALAGYLVLHSQVVCQGCIQHSLHVTHDWYHAQA